MHEIKPPVSDLKGKVRSSVLWSLVRTWGNRLGGVIVFFFLARLLGPAEFGVFAAVLLVINFLEIVAEQGFGDAVVQRTNLDDSLLNAVFLVNVITAICLISSIWVFADQIAATLAVEGVVEPLQVASFGILASSLGFCQLAMCRRSFNYKLLAIRSVIAIAIGGAVGVLMAIYGFGVWALVAQFLVASFVNLVALWIRPAWKPSTTRISFSGLFSLTKYSLNIFALRVLDFVNLRGVEYFIGAFAGVVALGVFSVGAKIFSILMQLFSSVVLDVAHSAMSRLKDQPERLLRAYYFSVRASAIIAFPILGLIAMTATEICVVVFGDKWEESGEVLAPLSILGMLLVIQYFNGAGINAIGRPHFSLLIVLVRAILSLSALYIFKDRSVVELSYVFCVSQLAASPLSFYFARSIIGFSFRVLLKKLMPVIAVSFLSFLISFLIQYFTDGILEIFRIMVVWTITLSVYFILLRFFVPDFIVEFKSIRKV